MPRFTFVHGQQGFRYEQAPCRVLKSSNSYQMSTARIPNYEPQCEFRTICSQITRHRDKSLVLPGTKGIAIAERGFRNWFYPRSDVRLCIISPLKSGVAQ